MPSVPKEVKKPDFIHTLLVHNCSGFNKNQILDFMQADFSFIFIQETHHLPSSKDIYDSTNRYLTFHASAVDENVHVTCRTGGIITYVNTKILAQTTIHSSSKSFLATITGNLVCINVYLPQRNLHGNGEYDNAVGDIIAIVEDLGASYGYLIVGDFNSSGPNELVFDRLKQHLALEDWSKEILVTFSTGVRNDKVCATKLDHVLAKNIETESLISCKVDTTLPTKGGHSALVATACFPHLDSVPQVPDQETAEERPIYLDFDKVTKEQLRSLRQETADIIQPYLDEPCKPSDNPIDIINRVFNTIGSRATFILDQKAFAHRFKKVPGWTKYGMTEIQRQINLVEDDWREKGCVPDSAELYELNNLRKLRQSTYRLIRRDEQRLTAEAMADDISGPSTRDKSRSWKPVRACIKGNTEAVSPIIEGRRDQKSIVDFWLGYYRAKLDGLESPNMRDSSAFKQVANTNSPKITINPSHVIKAIESMNKNCAYFDHLGPKLLALISGQFSVFFVKYFNDFLSREPESQMELLAECPDFLVSYIRPIIKSSSLNATKAKSYRPISVSHTLVVLIERLICDSFFSTKTPHNFFGYIKERSCDIAVKTLKELVRSRDLESTILVTLDASGAFESVVWDKIFPVLLERNNPKIVSLIWMFYRLNRYVVRWGNHTSSSCFYATRGTKQGGILSGYIFLEYMAILADRLQVSPGISLFGRNWNSLFYADDVLLLGQSKAHTQILLSICEQFQNEGYIKWNASKTAVIQLTKRKFLEPPKFSSLRLNGEKLLRKTEAPYLGYILNQRFNDDFMIRKQCRRLYCLSNNLQRSLPLHLLSNSRLKKIVCAYGNIYMLPILDNPSTLKLSSKLKTAHRDFVMYLTLFKERNPDLWDPDKGLFNNKSRYVYGRLSINSFDTMVNNQQFSFNKRFLGFLSSIKP